MNRILIRNVGPIVEMEFDIKDSIVFIGPQSSGKSIVAKIITILRSTKLLGQDWSFEMLIDFYLIKNYFNDKSYIKFDGENYEFEYKDSKYELKYKNEELKFNLKNLNKYDIARIAKRPPKQYFEILEKLKSINVDSEEGKEEIKSLQEEIGIIQQLVEIGKMHEKAKSLSSYSYYIPAERNLTSIISNAALSFTKANIPIPPLILEFASVIERARKSLTTLKVECFDDIEYRNIDNRDHVYVGQANKSFLLSESSSGYQTIIPLVLFVENILRENTKVAINATFVVEEPELNLYPITQYSLIKFLYRSIIVKSSLKNNLIITTHSPYILSSINNLLLNNKIKNSKKSLGIPSLDPHKFIAYFLNGGKAKLIFDSETGLISENELDQASEYILNDFEYLMNEYKKALNDK